MVQPGAPTPWAGLPVAYAGYALKPAGFVDGNPALALPRLGTRGRGTHCA